MAQVASGFSSSKNQLISATLSLGTGTYAAVTALGPAMLSAVGTISANLVSCRINSANLFINQAQLQATQSSVWPFTVYFFSATPTILGQGIWDWQYTLNSSYVGSISLIGTSNTQTGSTGSVYSSALGFGSGTQPGTCGQPLDVIFSPSTSLTNLYFVVITNYAITGGAALTGSPTMVLTINVSTL